MFDTVPNRIGTLSVRAPGRDTPTLRGKIARALSGVDLQPVGMPPAAILYIDRLAGSLPLEALAGHPASHRQQPWIDELGRQLAGIYQRAARPASGRIQAQAEAVLFRDRAELLACFCRDLLDGVAERKWWWQRNHAALLSSLTRSAVIRTVLLEAPPLIPAVFEQLAEWQKGIELATQLQDGDADSLTAALLGAYSADVPFDRTPAPQAPGWAGREPSVGQATLGLAAGDSWFSDASDYRFMQFRNPAQRQSARASVAASGPAVSPPWIPLITSQVWSPHLSRSQACLLGLARTAASNPQLLRNATFSSQVAAWWSRARDVDTLEPRGRTPGEGLTGGAAPAGTHRDARLESHGVEGARPGRNSARAASNEREPPTALPPQYIASDDARAAGEGTAPGAGETGGANAVESMAAGGLKQAQSTSPAFASAESSGATAPTADADSPDRPAAGETASSDTQDADAEYDGENDAGEWPNWHGENYIETRLGGLFYLINLLDQLELPEVFDTEWQFATRLGHWGFFELVAHALWTGHSGESGDDPVWKLLALLSGRKRRQRPGDRYPGELRPDYRLPRNWWDWYRGLHERGVTLQWAVKAGRLRVWCPDFVLLDSPLPDALDLQTDIARAAVPAQLLVGFEADAGRPLLEGEFDRAPLDAGVDTPGWGIAGPPADWVALCLPFVRLFICRQLQLDSANIADLVEGLLHLPARIYFTRSHIDMVADVNLTSLDIRRSGLDQDPGWHPRYGRVVQFHFSHV